MIQFGLCLLDEGTDVSSLNIALDRDESLILFPGDLARPDNLLHFHQFRERHLHTVGSVDQDRGDRFPGISILLLVTDHDIESSNAFEDLTGHMAADRCANHILHLGNVDSVTSDGPAVDADEELRSSTDLVHLDIDGTFNGADYRGDPVGLSFQHIEIFTEQLDCQLGTNTFQ